MNSILSITVICSGYTNPYSVFQNYFYLYIEKSKTGPLHQEQNHKSTTQQPVSRAAAHTGGSKATASFPAAATIQCYTEENFFDTDFRFSEDIKMAVEKNGAQLFLAEHGVQVGEQVLKKIFSDDEDRIYKINTEYIQDCGMYAHSLMYKMGEFVKQDNARKSIKNADVEEGRTDIAAIFDQVNITSRANPDVGEAYYVFNNPADSLYGKIGGHFNFHWGAVVAKSGSDVITAEADSNASDMWFQMYNTSKFNQSFKDNWYSRGKLDATAKEFQVRMSKSVSSNSNSKKVIEVIDLDDSDD